MKSIRTISQVSVNGKDAHPFWAYLKEKAPGFAVNAIKWNFTKFLVSRDGANIKRFATNVMPLDMEKDIVEMLAQEAPPAIFEEVVDENEKSTEEEQSRSVDTAGEAGGKGGEDASIGASRSGEL